MKFQQIQLFDAVVQAYSEQPENEIHQQALYKRAAALLNLSEAEQGETCETRSGGRFNRFERDCRWVQQTLKAKGLLRRVSRGIWELTKAGKETLSTMKEGYACLAFNTDLGIAVWGDAKTVAQEVIQDPIHLILTSPPYPHIKRNYGQFKDTKAYVEFLVRTLEPYVHRMADGAGLVLNVGNDVFEKGRPARSLYVERLLLELHDSLKLELVERIIWQSNKCPGPTQWAFVRRVMLRSGFEFTFCFTNNAETVAWDNRNILEDHSAEYLEWCRNGGQKTAWANTSYSKRSGAFSGTSEKRSKIPTNVMTLANNGCREGRLVRAYAKSLGLPEHTATFPTMFAAFFIKWMTSVGDLVVDPFGGTLTVGAEAERHGRRWVSCDRVKEFLLMGSCRFQEPSVNPCWQ